MSEPEYVMLNPVCSEIDEKNVWRRTHEPYLDFSQALSPVPPALHPGGTSLELDLW